MAIYFYQGTDDKGANVEQKVEAADRYAVYEIARRNGHSVTTISEASTHSLGVFFDVHKIEYAISRVKDDELVMVTRNLGSMLVAGLPLSRALSVIERQSKNPRLKGVVNEVREQITKGSSFHEALEMFPKEFSDLYVAMIRAGEESGGLSESLQTLSTQMERTSSLKKRIKGAMIYPAIVISILIIIGFLMMIYVMPSITDTFKSLDVELPLTTTILIGVSDFMVANTILTLGVVVGFIVGFMYFLKTALGKRVISYIIPRLPVIGNIAKEANAARASRTLSSLLSSGVDVIRALSITSQVLQNVYYREVVEEAMRRVEKGIPLSQVFVERDDLFPVLVGEMILVGEETGNISKMLKEMAVFYEGEVEQKTKDLSTIIEPILMVVIGASVGFFALAMISPIYSISDAI